MKFCDVHFLFLAIVSVTVATLTNDAVSNLANIMAQISKTKIGPDTGIESVNGIDETLMEKVSKWIASGENSDSVNEDDLHTLINQLRKTLDSLGELMDKQALASHDEF